MLARQAISFMEWLLLATIKELHEEQGKPPSQAALSRRTGLSERVVSYWMDALSELSLVDRDAGSDGRTWGVVLTTFGERTLELGDEQLEQAGLTG